MPGSATSISSTPMKKGNNKARIPESTWTPGLNTIIIPNIYWSLKFPEVDISEGRHSFQFTEFHRGLKIEAATRALRSWECSMLFGKRKTLMQQEKEKIFFLPSTWLSNRCPSSALPRAWMVQGENIIGHNLPARSFVRDLEGKQLKSKKYWSEKRATGIGTWVSFNLPEYPQKRGSKDLNWRSTDDNDESFMISEHLL